RRLMQRGQRVLHAGAVDTLLLEAGDDLRPAGAVGEQSVYEDDIPGRRRCLGAGDSIEQGKGGASGDSPDQCPAVHHSLLSNYGLFRSVLGKSVARLSVIMLRVFMASPLAAPALPPAAQPQRRRAAR